MLKILNINGSILKTISKLLNTIVSDLIIIKKSIGAAWLFLRLLSIKERLFLKFTAKKTSSKKKDLLKINCLKMTANPNIKMKKI